MMLAEQLHTTTITIPAIDNGIEAKQNDNTKSPRKRSEQNRSNRTNITSSSSNNNTATETTYSTSSITSSLDTTTDHRTDNEHRSNRQQHTTTSWISFQDNLAENYLERGRRLNGLQLPLHPLQISGWVAIFGFGVSTFCVLIPALHPDLQTPLFYIVSCLYLIHGLSHLAALLIDPSDNELRKQSSTRIVPEFDRTKHAHVIENGRCHLCNIKTTNFRTKHCSVCNKCVAQFDHHCKWLNHCVGGRNYVAFLMCVVSAVIAAMVILAAVISELVLYYMKSDWLIMWKVSTADIVTNMSGTNTFLNQTNSISSTIFNDTFIASINDTTIMNDSIANVTDAVFVDPLEKPTASPSGISIQDTIFLAFISALGILAAITVGLLLHLCFFHVYISFLGLTTYEYIRNQRQLETKQKKTNTTNNTAAALNAMKKSSTSTQIYFCSHIDPKNLIESHETKASRSIHCCDTSMQYENKTHDAFYLCSILHDRPSPILVPSSMAHELTLNSSRSSRAKTFHCCSEYKQIVKLSGASSQREYNDETTANNDGSATETSSIDEYVKFFEQCTFCSFKLKTAKRRVSDSTINRQLPDSKTPHPKRKWMCCSNVPESPDADVANVTSQLNTISGSIEQKANHHHHIQNRLRGAYDEHKSIHKNGAKSTANGSAKVTTQQSMNKKNRSSLTTNLKTSNRSRVTTQTTWPLRLRHMFRVFGRCQQPHNVQNSTINKSSGNGNGNGNGNANKNSHSRNKPSSPRRNIKQNQIRPMDPLELQYERENSRQSHDSNSNNHSSRNSRKNGVNRHNDSSDDIDSNNSNNEIITIKGLPSMPPPPPVRRKICPTPAADIPQDLAESLSFVQNPSHHHHHYPSRSSKRELLQQQQEQLSQPKVQPQPAQRTIGSSVNNRRRRKNVFRTRSPNLSPIHESGYSNPTSPQPCRHTSSNSHGSESSETTPKMSHQNEKLTTTERK